MTLTSNLQTQFILPLSSAEASLGLAGGKGANLARLVGAGLPVPGGFVATTRAYQAFVETNQIGDRIQQALPVTGEEDPEACERASQTIRALFVGGQMTGLLVEELRFAYSQIGAGAVAVRSSATAEDLPGMSFAGQQDTYLNIIGEESLLKAVVDCWSSLWTGRAIGYRAHNHVPQTSVALAVVVQAMVESQVSGVMFTANPLSGLRRETVIDATLGLGEALVSGQVEPDHYVIDPAAGRILQKMLGTKALSIRSQAGGGTVRVSEAAEIRQALPDPAVLALAQLGQQVEAIFGFPQDIEFAWVDGQPYLLQSRPITSLFPIPEGMTAEPLQVLASFAAVQGMLDPITPLGRHMFQMVFAAGARLFGRHFTAETQPVLALAAERFWINYTPIVRNSVGRRITLAALGYVEPTLQQIMAPLLEDPGLQPGKPGIRLHSLRQLAGFAVPVAINVLLNLAAPDRRRNYILNRSERILARMQSRLAALTGESRVVLGQSLDLIEKMLAEAMPPMFTLFVSGVASGMASYTALTSLAAGLAKENGTDWKDRSLELMRGLPHNPTTEMDLNLWESSQVIRGDPQALAEFDSNPATVLAQRYLKGGLAPTTTRVIRAFLDRYGMRGLAEIDLGRPRWSEDPTYVFNALGGYLHIDNPDQAPDAVFRRGAASAGQTLADLCAALRRTRGGWVKVRRALFFGNRMRRLLGIRESPKFFAIRMFAHFRRQLLRLGAELAAAGVLDAPDDLVYLTGAELRRMAGAEAVDWKSLVAQRREVYQRELLRRQIPRILLSDGRVFYEGMAALAGQDAQALNGSPVSPGSVEGRVRIVLDPRQAHLLPGEILVCPGTDPSWTPLFLTAGGLVMEVGGMMTHGAVVAREYGIPAVVGVDQATHRLKTGQRIRLDGSTGSIYLLVDGDRQVGGVAQEGK